MTVVDKDISVFLMHHGVHGMHWGVRRDRRANRFAKVGGGRGTKSEKLRSYTDLGPIDFIKGRGLRGGARRKGNRILNANESIRNGHHSARTILTYVANTRQQDLFPTSKSAKNTHAAIGASIAGAMLVGIGRQYLRGKA